MKKDTLIEVILGTVGGLVAALGFFMCLMTEWDMLVPGIVVAVIGVVILLCIIPVYRKTHPRKQHVPINWGIVLAWFVGIVGALIMGFGMSKVMIDGAAQGDMIMGIVAGIIGLLICVLDYPIYAYLKGGKSRGGN